MTSARASPSFYLIAYKVLEFRALRIFVRAQRPHYSLSRGATLLAQDLRSTSEGRDQRAKPRISLPFPADVHGKDEKGKEFNITTVLDNVSGNGLYMRMMPCVDLGAKLSIVLRLLTPSDLVDAEPRFAIEGVVVRAEEKSGGACGVAVTFDSVRFM